MEKGLFPRYASECPIRFQGDAVRGKGTVLNISRGGWKVRSDQSMQPRTYFSLRVAIPDEAPPMNVDLAVVRWAEGLQFGLAIIRIDTEDWNRLWRFTDSLASRVAPRRDRETPL